MNKDISCQKNALIITVFLVLLCLCSIIFLLPREDHTVYTADLYQDGVLIMSIPLDGTREERIFTVEGKGGCVNQIQVLPHSIGILSADCPDQLCVRQGFIQDSRLPITCLPNRLVIQLRPLKASGESREEPDILTY